MHLAASYDALVPSPVYQALKAFRLAAMAFSICSFFQQLSWHQPWGWIVPHTSSVVLSRPVLMLFQISSVATSATPADALTCKLKTSWKWLLVWGSLSFQTLRWGVNLCLDFDGTSILMSHTRSWCCRATSSPGITFTSVTSLHMVFWKRMKSICVARFPDLYVMRWLSHFLKHINIYFCWCLLQKRSLENIATMLTSFMYHVRIKMIFLCCELSRLTHGVVGQMRILIHSGFDGKARVN